MDALYDVLLRVTETAALTASSYDANSLEQARAGLEDARSKLGAWLVDSIGAQDATVVRLQSAPDCQTRHGRSYSDQNRRGRWPNDSGQTTQEKASKSARHSSTAVTSFSEPLLGPSVSNTAESIPFFGDEEVRFLLCYGELSHAGRNSIGKYRQRP